MSHLSPVNHLDSVKRQELSLCHCTQVGGQKFHLLRPGPLQAPDTTKAQDLPLDVPLDHRTDGIKISPVLETSDASPVQEEILEERIHSRGPFGRSYYQYLSSRTPSPRSSPKEIQKNPIIFPSPVTSSSDSDSHSSRSQSSSSKKRYHPHTL